jgi:hypothetical protein
MLVKASIVHLDSLEKLSVQWNPSSYAVSRETARAEPVPGAVDADARPGFRAERFETILFLDATAEEGEARNARRDMDKLERWSEPSPETGLPPRLLFSWGPFSFRGSLEEVSEEWIRFDPDGTPVRGRVSITLRR